MLLRKQSPRPPPRQPDQGLRPMELFSKDNASVLSLSPWEPLTLSSPWAGRHMPFIWCQEVSDSQPESKKDISPLRAGGSTGLGRSTRQAAASYTLVATPAALLRMGCPGGTALSFLLVFVPVYLHGAWSQEAGPAGQRKPFFERLRRLEEQVNTHRFCFVCFVFNWQQKDRRKWSGEPWRSVDTGVEFVVLFIS